MRLSKNTRAMVNMMAIVGLALGLIVASAVLPSAIDDFSNETSWGDNTADSVKTLFTVVVPISVAVALVYMIVKKAQGD